MLIHHCLDSLPGEERAGLGRLGNHGLQPFFFGIGKRTEHKIDRRDSCGKRTHSHAQPRKIFAD